MATTSTAEVEFDARVDAAEAVERWTERMVAAYGDSAVTDWDLDARRAEAFGDDPDPHTPSAPAAVPFTRRRFDPAEHCRRIGAHGGAATVARHGTAHMAVIRKAGARTTIERHGGAFFRGIVAAKGWAGPARRSWSPTWPAAAGSPTWRRRLPQ